MRAMANQHQQSFNASASGSNNDSNHNNNGDPNNSNNVDDITLRLDQMNVDTAATLDFDQCRSSFDFTNADQEEVQMMVDDENVHPTARSQQHLRFDLHKQHYQSPNQQQQKMTQQQQQRYGESNILIVTNVDPNIFRDPLVKAKFESLFRVFDEHVLFRYLKSFRRVRLDFTDSRAADSARRDLNNCKLGNTAFKCYLAQIIRPNNQNSLDLDKEEDDDGNTPTEDDYDTSQQQYGQLFNQQRNNYLNIPKLSKQFLISPPVSPPVGWKPHEEGSPCIDVQLISAIANLVPGQVHEIHPASESQPGIFVEVCEEAQYDSASGDAGSGGKRIPKTANPIAAARAAIGQAMRSS